MVDVVGGHSLRGSANVENCWDIHNDPVQPGDTDHGSTGHSCSRSRDEAANGKYRENIQAE